MNKWLLAGVLAIAAVAGPVAATATAEDWPGYAGGGGQNRAAASEPGLELGTLWKSSFTTWWPGCPTVSAGSVYIIAIVDENADTPRLLRLDAQTGAVLWRSVPLPARVGGCPAVDGDHVYISRGADVAAYDVADGSLAWSSGATASANGLVVADGSVLATGYPPGSSTLAQTAFAAADGTVRWSVPTSSPVGVAPLVVGGALLTGSTFSRGMSAYAVADGAALWSDASGWVFAGDDGDVFIASETLDGPMQLTSRDSVTGAVAWSVPLPGYQWANAVVADRERVYVLTDRRDGNLRGRVIAFDRATGAQLWNVATHDLHDGNLARLGRHVLSFGYSGGSAYDPETGATEELGDGFNWLTSWSAYADSTFYTWRQSGPDEYALEALRDIAAPALSDVAPAGDLATRTRRPTFAWTVDDGRGTGVKSVELVLGDGPPIPLGPASGSRQPPSDLADGRYVWRLRARDVAGNESSSDERLLTVDTVAPGPFELRAPVGGTVVSEEKPLLSWSMAVDATSGVAEHRVAVDGAVVGTLSGPWPPGRGCCEMRLAAPLSDGAHTWSVTALDRAGNERTVDGGAFTVEAPPTGTLTASKTLGHVGESVRLNAAFTDPNGSVVSYAWDLDGDGTFELTTGGQASRQTVRLNAVGTSTYRVKATDDAGLSAVAEVSVEARPAPPGGELGVSINDGAIATNSRQVELTLSWPAFVTHALVSNDGGFGAAGATAQLPIAQRVRWTLPSSGSERLPKIVYVRFRGGNAGRETYTDDIILDEQAPLFDMLREELGGRSAATAAAMRSRTFAVRARDANTGVVAVQVSRRRSAKGAITKRLVRKNARGPRRFAGKVKLRAPGGRVWVRVLDAAGNGSRWRRTAR